MKHILAVDMDGVLVDFNRSFVKLLMGIQPGVKVDELSSDFPSCWDYPTHYGFSKDTQSRAWTEVRGTGIFWQQLYPYANSYRDLELLGDFNKAHDVYFVTSRCGDTAKFETEKWIKQYGFHGYPTVVVTPDSRHKAMVTEAIGATAIVDDKPSNLEGHVKACRTFLFKQPYNVEAQSLYHTVTSIEEVINELKR